MTTQAPSDAAGQGIRDQRTGFVRNWEDVAPVEFAPGVKVQLLTGEGVTMNRAIYTAGALVPEHSHPQEQMTYLVSGKMRCRVGSDQPFQTLTSGDVFYVPANVAHISEAIEDCVVLEAFSPRRQDMLDRIWSENATQTHS